MKEFGGVPSDWRSQSTKDIKSITTLLSTYNKVKNLKMERKSKQGSRGVSSGASRGAGNARKFRREERVGPNGTEIVDIPI